MLEKNLQKGIDYTGLCSVFWCHDGSGKYFLSKRSDQCRDERGRWESPGGGLNFGESPDEALARELKEEFGCIKFNIDEVLPPSSVIRTENGVTSHWIAFAYVLQVESGDMQICEPDKVDAIGWFTLDDLPRPMHTATEIEVEKFSDILEKYSSFTK